MGCTFGSDPEKFMGVLTGSVLNRAACGALLVRIGTRCGCTARSPVRTTLRVANSTRTISFADDSRLPVGRMINRT